MQYEIRAMSLGEILDTGFRILRNHAGLLLGIALVIAIPSQGIQLLAADPAAPGALAGMVFIGLTLIVLSPLASAAITHAVGELYLGRDATIGDSYRLSLSLLLPLVGTALLAGLAVVVGMLLLVIPGVYLMLAFALISQVIVLERTFGVKALSRSRELMKGNLLRAIAIYLVIGILQLVLGGGLALALSFLPIAAALGGALVQALSLAYSTAVLVALYFDIRCRKEAFDLAYLAQQVERGAPTPAPVA